MKEFFSLYFFFLFITVVEGVFCDGCILFSRVDTSIRLLKYLLSIFQFICFRLSHHDLNVLFFVLVSRGGKWVRIRLIENIIIFYLNYFYYETN